MKPSNADRCRKPGSGLVPGTGECGDGGVARRSCSGRADRRRSRAARAARAVALVVNLGRMEVLRSLQNPDEAGRVVDQDREMLRADVNGRPPVLERKQRSRFGSAVTKKAGVHGVQPAAGGSRGAVLRITPAGDAAHGTLRRRAAARAPGPGRPRPWGPYSLLAGA